MTEYKLTILLGSVLGILHGIILWAAIQTFSSVTKFTVQNATGMNIPYYAAGPVFGLSQVYSYSFQIVLAVDITIMLVIVSAVWWLPKLERFVEEWNDGEDASDEL